MESVGVRSQEEKEKMWERENKADSVGAMVR